MPGNENILISWWKWAIFHFQVSDDAVDSPIGFIIVKNMGLAVRISKISQSIADI